MEPKKEKTLMWSACDKKVQSTPILKDTTYSPEFTSEECEKLSTGKCPLENGITDSSCPCVALAKELASGIVPENPIEILHDDYKNIAIFKSGSQVACVYNHIAKDFPGINIPTEIRPCRFYVDLTPKYVYILTKGEWTDTYGTPSAFINRRKRDRELLKNSKKTKFAFPASLAEREIIYAHGKYAVVYDTSWTVINPEKAFDLEYAFLSYMHHFTDEYPKDTQERCSIFFSNADNLSDAYKELKAFDPYWIPGTTDNIYEEEYRAGEPRRVSADRG